MGELPTMCDVLTCESDPARPAWSHRAKRWVTNDPILVRVFGGVTKQSQTILRDGMNQF